MKRFLFALAALALAFAMPLRAQSTLTLGSTAQAPRTSPTSNYVDWWLVNPGPCKLISIFGYNSGSQGWVQIFDAGTANGAALPVSYNSGAANNEWLCANHGLTTGQRVQVTNTLAGVSAGIYYARPLTSTLFYLYDTLAHSQAAGAVISGATGQQVVTGTGSGYQALVPVHSFAVAANDNFSLIVPVSGMVFGHGLTVAGSTTAATYTPGGTNLVITCTLTAP